MRRWKVVARCNDEEFCSAVAGGKAAVRYVPGEYSYAPKFLAKRGYGLVVFRTLRDAKVFFSEESSYPDLVVFECTVVGRMKRMDTLDVDLLKEGTIERSFYLWPAGTEFYQRVKLTKQME